MRVTKEVIQYTTLEDNTSIVDIYSLDIMRNNINYFVSACYTGEHDTYSIRIYENGKCISEASLDSCGGGFGDEILTTGCAEIDEFILDKLYGKDNGRIIPF